MIADPTLLLPLAVLWPMLLAGLALLPGWGSRMVLLLPLGPLPALAAALVASRDVPVALPGVLLDSGLELGATGALLSARGAEATDMACGASCSPSVRTPSAP